MQCALFLNFSPVCNLRNLTILKFGILRSEKIKPCFLNRFLALEKQSASYRTNGQRVVYVHLHIERKLQK